MQALRQLAILEAGGQNQRSIEILGAFQMRSLARELEVDSARVDAVSRAIDATRAAVVAEHDGLVERIKAVVLKTKEAPKRPRAFQPHRDSSGVLHELGHAEARLARLSAQIRHLDDIRDQIVAAFAEPAEYRK